MFSIQSVIFRTKWCLIAPYKIQMSVCRQLIWVQCCHSCLENSNRSENQSGIEICEKVKVKKHLFGDHRRLTLHFYTLTSFFILKAIGFSPRYYQNNPSSINIKINSHLAILAGYHDTFRTFLKSCNCWNGTAFVII